MKMKIDNYTRFMLTVIAFCLLYLSINSTFWVPYVHAEQPSTAQNASQMDQDMARWKSQLATGNEPVRIDAIEADTVTGGIGVAGKDVLGFSCLPTRQKTTCFVLSRQR
jgi:hypothetical protein